jgi:hypothetical protein
VEAVVASDQPRKQEVTDEKDRADGCESDEDETENREAVGGATRYSGSPS